MLEISFSFVLFSALTCEWYPSVLTNGDYGSLSYSFSSSLISIISFTTLTLGGVLFSIALLPIGPPIVVFGLVGLFFYILNAILFLLLRIVYTVNAVRKILFLSEAVTRIRGLRVIKVLSEFNSRPVMFNLTAVITIIAILLSILLMPIFAFPAALISLLSLFLTPLFWLISLVGVLLFVPSVIASAFLFLIDMAVWIAEVLSLSLPGLMLEGTDFSAGKNARHFVYLIMDQLIMKYIIFCMALGVLQVIEGCFFLTTFFASPLGLIKIAFGAALFLVALFGAIITDGRIFHYLKVYIADPVLGAVKNLFAGDAINDMSKRSHDNFDVLCRIDSPCLLGIGTIFTDSLTGFLEMCGEALAVLAVVPLGLSTGMIALSLLPFVSVVLTDLFVTLLMWLPVIIALSLVFLLLMLYLRGRCTALVI